jgi:hypothetical protein
MQANSGGRAENLGYFVPPSIIRHVLKDSEDNIYDGFPDLGFRTQTLDSPSAKAAYGLRKNQNGVLIIKVFDGSPTDGIFEENDVIMKIDDFDIAEDGTIQLSDDLLTDYKHAIDMHHIGDEVLVTYSRNGNEAVAKIKADAPPESYSLVKGEQFDQIPKYYIYGGVLFVPLNMNLIKRWGNDWGRSAPVTLLQARNEWASPEKHEVVVALQVLAADVNLGYHDWRNWIVDDVNGEQVRDFEHFSQIVRNNTQENIVLENKNGYQMVINHRAAIASEAEILAQYRIPAAYSTDLFPE